MGGACGTGWLDGRRLVLQTGGKGLDGWEVSDGNRTMPVRSGPV
jgi:hypothetical protein